MFSFGIINQLKAQLPCIQHKTGVLEKDNINSKPQAYRNIREADIAWTKRVYLLIDFKYKMNQMYAYKGTLSNDKVGFIDILFCALKEGILKTYADDNFTIPYKYLIYDSIEKNNPDTGIPYTTATIPIFKLEDITQLKIKEDWLIDKSYNVLDARIIGMCPMIIERDSAGDFVRNKPMFWIYFPDLRNLLVNIEIYSKGEPKDTITWDDIFAKHIFYSTIVKESNTSYRKITDYRTGKDAIIESETIKGRNQDMDEDLKDY